MQAASSLLAKVKEAPNRFTWGLWGVLILVISILVGLQPEKRTVTGPYHDAVHAWWSRTDIYSHVGNAHEYQYLPQSALFFTPFTWPSLAIGEVLWRWACVGLLVSALWRLANLIGGRLKPYHFLLITLLCLPASLSSARNGQFNMPLAALLVHAAVDIAEERWLRAGLMLPLAFAFKPLALPMALVAAVLYPPLRIRILGGLIAVMAFPYTCAAPDYVTRQYRLFWLKLGAASNPKERFSNLLGIFRTFHIPMPHAVFMGLALAGGVAVLFLAWRAAKVSRPRQSALFVLALCSVYLMLFNPKTETNSYVILAPSVAAFGVIAWSLLDRKGEGKFLLALSIALGSENFGKALFHATDFWFKPIVAILFLGYVCYLIRRGGWTEKEVSAANGASPVKALA